MQKLTLALLLVLPVVASSAIYKHYDENGVPYFSDRETPGAEKIEDKPLPLIEMPPLPAKTIKTPPKGKFTYSKIEITRPTNGEDIRENAGNLNIKVNVTPQLKTKAGHKLTVFYDGEAITEPAKKTSFSLKNIDRGAHSLQAKIFDKKGNEIGASDTINFSIKRHSALFPNKKQ